MKIARAIVTGTVGTVIVYVMVYIAGVVSTTEADLCLLSGASITGSAGAVTWLLGAIGQLVIGMIAALVYAAIFEWITQHAGAVVGLVAAIAHVVVAGIAVAFLPAERLLGVGILPPGAFMEYRGLLVAAVFCIAHLVFGAFVGALYGRPLHSVDPRTTTWRDVSF